MFRHFLRVLLALGLLLSFGAAQDKAYSADRFESNAVAVTDGSLAVQESVTFRFQGGPFSYVFREIPTDNTDGIVNIVAGVDGQPWPPGTGLGQVELSDGNPVRIEWNLSPTSDTVRRFDVSYLMLGVTRQGESTDILRWQPLPDDYDYSIAEGRFSISYPDSAVLVGEPAILNGRADVTFDEDRVNFAVNNLEPDEPLIVELAFEAGTLISAPPAWQAEEVRQYEGRWAWIAASIAALGAGLAGLFVLLRSTRRGTPVPKSSIDYLGVPPGKLAPALAGALQSQKSSPSWPHALGTLFDLAERGVLTITEIPAEKWYQSRDFEIVQVSQAADLHRHEREMVKLLFTDKRGSPQQSIRLSKLGKEVTSFRWDAFKSAVRRDLSDAGLVDRDRDTAHRNVLAGGILILAVSLGLLILAVVLMSQIGPWALLLAAAVFLVSIVWMIASSTISPLSEYGMALAAEWEPFYHYIKDAASGKTPVQDPASFEALLPYATAYEQGEAWARRFDRLGYCEVPSYFQAFVTADAGSRMGAFVALMANSATSGGSASGSSAAGAGGAAGGGSSGAG
jgi:hypothetical protein